MHKLQKESVCGMFSVCVCVCVFILDKKRSRVFATVIIVIVWPVSLNQFIYL